MVALQALTVGTVLRMRYLLFSTGLLCRHGFCETQIGSVKCLQEWRCVYFQSCIQSIVMQLRINHILLLHHWCGWRYAPARCKQRSSLSHGGNSATRRSIVPVVSPNYLFPCTTTTTTLASTSSTLASSSSSSSSTYHHTIIMNIRQRLQIILLLAFTLVAFASYNSVSGGTAWLQWSTVVTILFFCLVFDMSFTGESTFLFDPDADNWRRKTVSI